MRKHRFAHRMRGPCVLAAATLLAASSALGQLNSLTKDELIKITAPNPFERFPDGRPKVPSSILEKVREMSAEEVLGIARKGYPGQYVGDMKILTPGKTLVGRAFTLQLMPARPEIADVFSAEWKTKGLGRLNHQTALDMLQEGDVFVVDAFGNLDAGGIVGDNLAYYVFRTTKAGFVIDGGPITITTPEGDLTMTLDGLTVDGDGNVTAGSGTITDDDDLFALQQIVFTIRTGGLLADLDATFDDTTTASFVVDLKTGAITPAS